MSQRAAIFYFLFSLCVCFLLGCASAKPPPEPPVALRWAQRAAEQAAKLSQQQNWPGAAQAWQTTADQFHLLHDRANEAVALHNLAQAKREVGKPEEARTLLEQAAKLNEELSRGREWWRNQIALLQAEAQLSDTAALEARFQKLRPRAREISDAAIQGLFLNELGLWQQSQRQFDEAEAALKQAEQRFQSAKDDYGVAVVTANRAQLYESQKNFAAALDTWRVALARFEKLTDARGIAAALAGQGRTLMASSGDWEGSETLLRRAAQSYRVLNQPQRLADTLRALEACLAAQHKEAEAAEVRAEWERLQSRPSK